MKENKSIFLLFTICTLLISVIGTAFSYFLNKYDKETVVIKETNNISFIINTPIYFKEDQISDSTNAFANTEEVNYDISIMLEDLLTEEALLTIIAPNGVEIKEIEGLTYKDTNKVHGFDITGIEGKIDIIKNYKYEVNQNWQFILTYPNKITTFKSPQIIIKKFENRLFFDKICKKNIVDYIW